MMTAERKTHTLYWSSVSTPGGDYIFMATEQGVCWTGLPGTSLGQGISWAQRRLQIDEVVEGEQIAPLAQAMDEVRRYFAGERVQFSCPLDLHGTPFQQRVWQALCTIPYGETRSYGEIAYAIGAPTASRAVGAANGANPIALIVPCHRVIGSNGTLTGYGGGLPTKEWLLTLEGVKVRSSKR